MTPEQRAVKWFEKVPEADDLSFDQRLAICKKTGNTMALVFVVLFSLELILAYVLTDGSFVFTMTDILRSILSRPEKSYGPGSVCCGYSCGRATIGHSCSRCVFYSFHCF